MLSDAAMGALSEVADEYGVAVVDVLEGILSDLGKRRGGLPVGMKRVLMRPGAVATPDLNAASFPWPDVELLGMRPAGWSTQQVLEAYRNALVASPGQALCARASFSTGAANESGSASFTPTNSYFLGREFRFWKSDTSAVSVTGALKQAGKFPLTIGDAVRIETLFGGGNASAAGVPVRWVRLLAPREPLVLSLVAETAVGQAHNIDFAYHGWSIGLVNVGENA